MKTYKDLIVWQKSSELVKEIYILTRKFPSSELYGLTSQIRRSVISIPSNIAEGYCRSSRKEYTQFINVAFASGAELETQMILAKELKFTKEIDFKKSEILLEEVMKMLNVLLRKLKTTCLVANG
jgi:four helix bundle protein